MYLYLISGVEMQISRKICVNLVEALYFFIKYKYFERINWTFLTQGFDSYTLVCSAYSYVLRICLYFHFLPGSHKVHNNVQLFLHKKDYSVSHWIYIQSEYEHEVSGERTWAQLFRLFLSLLLYTIVKNHHYNKWHASVTSHHRLLYVCCRWKCCGAKFHYPFSLTHKTFSILFPF